jgi:ATP-dependent exoDNAse (exonuclease V) alpha subunit
MIFFVSKIVAEYHDKWECHVQDELGKMKYNLPIWKFPFQNDMEKDTYIPKDVVYCDFGYAITCHKSQGSEWPYVIVYDEWMPPKVWDMKRWRYTAITRAADKLMYLL